jgi:hypothetical protein
LTGYRSRGGRLEPEWDVNSLRGVRRLLEEDGRGRWSVREGNLADIYGDGQSLAGENGVHYGDVLVSNVGGRGDGEEENAGLEGGVS